MMGDLRLRPKMRLRPPFFPEFRRFLTRTAEAEQVLTNGIEVKLQRNALSVIEAPTGNEEDDDLEFDNMAWNGLEISK
ncbi:hypothetical protein QQ045_011607 [Rhodiola kirilowii]